MTTFDSEYRALLGPRPLRSDPQFAVLNRAYDKAYAALFPSEILPSYHPHHRKTKSNSVLLTSLEKDSTTNAAA